MPTKREQVLQAVTTALGAVPGVTGVYRSREDALSRQESPAIVVTWESETPTQNVIGYTDMRLLLTVGIYQRGSVPDQLADPIANAVHSALMADPTLGGKALDVSEAGASLEMDGTDNLAAWLTQSFEVWYRHQRANMSA